MELSTLVKRASTGDRAAFGDLVRRFQDMAFAGAYTWLGDIHLAQDAAQDAFLEAWACLPRLRQPAAFPGWFRCIVRKHADRHQRSRRPVLPVDELEEVASNLPDPLQLAEQGQLRASVHVAIAALPESQRLALTLFHLEGYTQKEVATFLGLPVSTVKKRIFDARRVLQERILYMVKEKLDEGRPSLNDAFAQRIAYFAALKDGDVEAVGRLLDANASLITLKKDWASAPEEVIPRNTEAATWAAMTNNKPLLTLLLDRGAALEPPGEGSEGLLHAAVMAGAHEAMQLLVERGAEVNRRQRRLTPLHLAVMRDDRVAVDILLAAGTDLEAQDQRQRTPAAWAALKDRADLLDHLLKMGARRPDIAPRLQRLKPRGQVDRKIPVGKEVLDRFLDTHGNPLDGTLKTEYLSLSASIDHPVSPILETGIKVIDLFAPIRRGGHAVLSGGTGVGKSVVASQLARNLAAEFDARIVFIVSPSLKPAFQFREWRTMLTDGRLLAEHTAYILAQPGDAQEYRQAAETGVGIADGFRQQGHEVLLIVDQRIALAPGVLPFLRTCTSSTPQAAVTTLYLASMPPGVADGPFDFVDTVIRLDGTRAREGLYPAVSPIHSTSRALADGLLEKTHLETVTQARENLGRYYEHDTYLGTHLDKGGHIPQTGNLWGTEAEVDDHQATHRLVVRGRRLDLFLTQPFHGTELWTGEPGETVPLPEALAGCRRILDGEFDGLPERAFHTIGAIEQAVDKAQRL